MMLSSEYIQLKICKTFCQTPRNGFDFNNEIWFENGSQPLLITDTVKHSGSKTLWQGSQKEFQKPCGYSQLYTSWSIYLSYVNGHIYSFQ